jgi:hypothetical protein
MRDELLKRLPASAAEERAIVEALSGLPNAIREKAAAIRADGRLSETGKAADVRTMAKGAPLDHLRQLRQRAVNMSADVTNQRKAFAPPAPDKTDLFAEAQRAELRAYVRSLSAGERFRAVWDDPALQEAVLQGHPGLSGLSTESEGEDGPSQFDRVKDHYLQTKFGEQIRAVERREEVVEVLNSAVEIATSQFRRESGLNEEEI